MATIEAMPKYEVYKDSGIDTIGKIPAKWTLEKLGFIGRFSASGIDKLSHPNESKVKIINFTDISSNESMILNSSRNYMIVSTPEANKKKHLVKKGDLIFIPSSETYEDLGLAALIDEDVENLSFSYHVIRFSFSKDVSHQFKKYLTNNVAVMSQFSKYGKGTTRKIVGRNVFKNILVSFPSVIEQRSIAEFLDTKIEKIDKSITIKKQQIELLKERKQIIIQKAVTEGLNPNVPMKDSGVDWIGEIPEHWETIRLKSLFKEKNDRTDTGKEVLLSLRMKLGLVPHDDVSDKPISDHELIGYKRVDAGQMVMNRMRAAIGIFGKPRTHGLVSPDYAVFDVIWNINLDYFLLLFKTQLLGTQFRLGSKGLGTGSSGFMRLYSENFGNIKVPFCCMEEQTEILTAINEENKRVEKTTEIIRKQIEKLKEYKATLINSAVTGKIKIREHDYDA